jgi:thiosulfate dehydrogenase
MFRSFILGVVLTLVAIGVAGYLIITTGTISAGADSGSLPLERWAARASLHATLNKQAPKEQNPVPLNDQNLIAGIQLYGEHCAVCHGTARGDASASGVAKGELPAPPQLATDGVEDDPEGVTYWKLDHGIRWTGMPSWKATLSDRQMWTLALFLKHMDQLPPAPEQAWQQVTNTPTSPPGVAPATPPGAQPGTPPAATQTPPSS